MHVILLEKITHLGGLGDKVSVKPGFARNYLIPQGKAVPATEANIVKFEQRRAELEKAAAEKLQIAQKRAEAVNSLNLIIKARAAEEGKLYGSIGIHELAEAIAQAGIEIHKSEIHLPNGPLRQIGEYEVLVQLHSDVNINLKVVVEAEA